MECYSEIEQRRSNQIDGESCEEMTHRSGTRTTHQSTIRFSAKQFLVNKRTLVFKHTPFSPDFDTCDLYMFCRRGRSKNYTVIEKSDK